MNQQEVKKPKNPFSALNTGDIMTGQYPGVCVAVGILENVTRPKPKQPEIAETVDMVALLFAVRVPGYGTRLIATNLMKFSGYEQSPLAMMLRGWDEGVPWDLNDMKLFENRRVSVSVALERSVSRPGQLYSNVKGLRTPTPEEESNAPTALEIDESIRDAYDCLMITAVQ